MKRNAPTRDLCRRAGDRTRCLALGLAIENDRKHAKLQNTRDPSQPHRWRFLLRGYCQCPGYSQAFASFTSLLLQAILAPQYPAAPVDRTATKSLDAPRYSVGPGFLICRHHNKSSSLYRKYSVLGASTFCGRR